MKSLLNSVDIHKYTARKRVITLKLYSYQVDLLESLVESIFETDSENPEDAPHGAVKTWKYILKKLRTNQMSDEKEYREFWVNDIDTGELRGYEVWLVKEQSDEQDVGHWGNRYHVIEYQAYLDVKAQLEVCRDALEFIKNTDCRVYTSNPYDNRRFELAFYDFKHIAARELDELEKLKNMESDNGCK